MCDSVTIVQALYDEFACGHLEAVSDLLDPDVEWVTPPTLPWSRGSYRGRTEVLEYFSSFAAALEQPVVAPQQLLDCGDGTVVALGRETARARPTGQQFSVPFAHVIAVCDGRVKSMRAHVDTASVCAAFEGAPAPAAA